MNTVIPVSGAPGENVLLIVVGSLTCALPLAHVAEVMRPLPVEPIAGTPAFVAGAVVLRGLPAPLIDLRILLASGDAGTPCGRFVSLCLERGQAVVGVDRVAGIAVVAPVALATLPALLRDLAGDRIAAITAADAGLLVVLRAARLVPEAVWAALTAHLRECGDQPGGGPA